MNDVKRILDGRFGNCDILAMIHNLVANGLLSKCN